MLVGISANPVFNYFQLASLAWKKPFNNFIIPSGVEIERFDRNCLSPFIDLQIADGEKSFHIPKLESALPRTKPLNSPLTDH
ncbi:14294_t:CDS:2 [Funneliformis caledonium]|uniref:14294_t:CDS:1 n=1 Tax=Funneliformis caledonium TaxID=1117310 RepID=A0A9N9H992_9GLOM|nr:14294_t:CDS:2 [Funneliformis caledonium]